MKTDVIIAGAGPVGLMLAGELRLGGVDVIVFERRAEPSGVSRGFGFTSRAAEVFDQRDLLTRFGDIQFSPEGHFGGVRIDPELLDESHFGVRGVPQARIEEALEEWAQELGAAIMRGHTLVGLEETADGVKVVVETPDGRSEHVADYLVGCDGGRSTVRRLGGFEFAGTEATRGMYTAEIIGRNIRPRYIGERVPGGMVMSFRLAEGLDRITVHEDAAPPPESDHVTTFAEVADAWQRLTGESLHDAETRWVSAFTDATRQATEYRRGRVFVAGDAAHIHLPAGQQGLSVGVQDAVNLGWKLAATINGWAPDGLLDTYHSERHPVGARVLCNTLAQGRIYLNGDELNPLRAILGEMMALPDVARHLAGMVSGLDIQYDMGVRGHALLGRRLPPNWELKLANGSRRRVAELLHRARAVLIDTEQSGGMREIVAPWSDRVDLIEGNWALPGADSEFAVESVLIRPDGYVAWVMPDGGELQTALRRWFGT